MASWFYIVPILGFLIFIHECGHFFAARMCGVKVEEFGMGLPPKLFGFVRSGTKYTINLIPFGGFVRVKGEDGDDMASDSMNAKSPGQRAFFLSAGIIMNVLFAVFLMTLVVGIKGMPHNEVFIAGVGPGSPAATAGWQVGDRIVSVNGQDVQTVQELVKDTRNEAGNQVQFVIERGGEFYESTLIPRKNPPEGEGRIGINLADPVIATVTVGEIAPGSDAAAAGLQSGDVLINANNRDVSNVFVLQTEMDRYAGTAMPLIYERNGEQFETTLQIPPHQNDQTPVLASGIEVLQQKPIFEKVPLIEVIPTGFKEAYRQTTLMVDGILEMFRNPGLLRQTAGPVGMAQLTHELVETTALPVWYTLASLTILLSLNLAFLNLLPIPALDGGRLLFVLVELIRGRRIAPEKEGLVHLVGFVVLIGLMFVIAFNDIRRIVGGDSFFG
ncbi:MAG: site-2 protease family protein [Thermomicrobiales bacterium]|nr:site-2 protease family protein [Thermomicrobiales bacterium]MCO5220406.1 site-2 protease family protein [Thermomicrobiales bacterium]